MRSDLVFVLVVLGLCALLMMFQEDRVLIPSTQTREEARVRVRRLVEAMMAARNGSGRHY